MEKTPWCEVPELDFSSFTMYAWPRRRKMNIQLNTLCKINTIFFAGDVTVKLGKGKLPSWDNWHLKLGDIISLIRTLMALESHISFPNRLPELVVEQFADWNTRKSPCFKGKSSINAPFFMVKFPSMSPIYYTVAQQCSRSSRWRCLEPANPGDTAVEA